MKKSKIINLIISIAAPILLVTAVVLIVSYGWYIRRQQIATIDANAKNLAIDYTFDSDNEKNKLRYEINNLVFFDNNSEFEYQYLADMAVKMSVHITNKSSNPVSYKLTFSSSKISDTNTVSYVDCLFSGVPAATSTIKTIETARENSNSAIVTYTDSTTERTAVYDSGETTIAVDGSLEVPIVLYLFGVQENSAALNEDFLYDGGQLVNTYAFTLTIESIPVGAATEEEKEEENDDNQGSNDNSGSGENQEP